MDRNGLEKRERKTEIEEVDVRPTGGKDSPDGWPQEPECMGEGNE